MSLKRVRSVSKSRFRASRPEAEPCHQRVLSSGCGHALSSSADERCDGTGLRRQDSASRSASFMIVKVGLALPALGNTEALAIATFGTAWQWRSGPTTDSFGSVPNAGRSGRMGAGFGSRADRTRLVVGGRAQRQRTEPIETRARPVVGDCRNGRAEGSLFALHRLPLEDCLRLPSLSRVGDRTMRFSRCGSCSTQAISRSSTSAGTKAGARRRATRRTSPRGPRSATRGRQPSCRSPAAAGRARPS